MGTPKRNLLGMHFGSWTVIGEAEPYANRSTRWLCRCDCGATSIVGSYELRNGGSVRCRACKWLLFSGPGATNYSHGMSKTGPYCAWAGMRDRCENQNNSSYRIYGGRGITVCSRWGIFEAFWRDMGPSYSPDLELDRIDNDGPYEPHNCRWTTRIRQCRNRRNTLYVDFQGGRRIFMDLCEELGLAPKVIRGRLRRGWSTDRAFGEVVVKRT